MFAHAPFFADSFPSLSRRRFLATAAMAGCATRFAFGLRGTPQTAPEIATVRTPLGSLRGTMEGDIRVFRGIPFAQPPVGPLRFRAPQPPAPWQTTRDATQFSAEAMQPGDGTSTKNVTESEDCLYLNVWAPATGGPHPVFVWIHGGGFTGGRSFDPTFNGAHFARAGIVCVTVAYRLGIFGFLDLGPLLGPAYNGSANNALRDLIAALTWVQGNIGAFGGDPRRVTVGGESAGAKLTDMLMGTPAAEPLFQQMISESGGAERIWSTTQAATIATSFAAQWKTTSGLDAAALKTAPAGSLIEAQESFFQSSDVHFPLRAQIDPTLIPGYPLLAIGAGSTRGKRLLLGTNRDESALFIGPHPQHDPGARELGNLPVAQFRPIEQHYAQIYPDMTAEQRRIRSLTAEEYWIPSIRVVDAHVRNGGNAFVYRFDYAPSDGRFAGEAAHASELAFVWNDRRAQAAPEAAALAQNMHAAWCAFIRGEAPAAPGLPAWPAYNLQTRPTMLLNTTSRVADDPQKAEFALWNGLLER